MTISTNVTPVVDDAVHTQLTRFYNAQSQAFDSGDAEAWAATFTEEATFSTEGMNGPAARGREALARGLRFMAAGREKEGVVIRHWMGMMVAAAVSEDVVRATSYAMIVEIAAGGVAGIKRCTVCRDELVRAAEGWLVRSRVVTLDGAQDEVASAAS